MMLTTIDFLVGEKNQPGNKIGECMHNILEVIHKFSPWLLLWLEKRCILSFLRRQWSVFLTWEKAYELPADQETDIGILCCSFITQLPTMIQTAHLFWHNFMQYIVYPWMVTFSPKPACLLQSIISNKCNWQNTQVIMVWSITC